MYHMINLVGFDLKSHVINGCTGREQQERLMWTECLMVQKREFLVLLELTIRSRRSSTMYGRVNQRARL